MSVTVLRESELDSFVDSFESMQEASGSAELTHFLPAEHHPEFDLILVELIRVDIEYRWRRGTQTSLDDYLSRFPMLKERKAGWEAICYEEYRQKLQAGHPVDLSDYQKRYQVCTDDWPAPTTSGLGSSSIVGTKDGRDKSDDDFPLVGTHFFGFDLIRELGRGAFARVFLAHQADLSDRPVVVKISSDRFSDAKTLARLQHTNIVPIYSVHREKNLEAICMPYFGSQTIHDLLRNVRSQPSMPPSGQFIIDTVTNAEQITIRRGDSSLGSPKRSMQTDVVADARSDAIDLNFPKSITGLSYVDAILLLAKKISSGLIHAHERGIVHCDLKPANVLLADDGEPMLLDFNLAMDLRQIQRGSDGFIGGTLPYMAPEQLNDFQKKRSGSDPRSDIFSFGIILYELLTGVSPYPDRRGALNEVLALSVQDRLHRPPRIRQINAAVSPASEAIILKCLEAHPANRYQSAHELFEDLDRQLTHLPLRYVVEPSWRERAHKWMQRHPRIVSHSGIGAMAGVLILAMASVLFIRGERLASFQAEQTWLRFQDNLRQAQVQITGASLADRDSLDGALKTCQIAMADFQLEDDCSGQISTLVRYLSPKHRNSLKHDAAELHFLMATVQGIQADFEDTPESRKVKLEAAMQSNQKSLSRYQGEAIPASVLQQKRWLESEAGDDVELQSSMTTIAPSGLNTRDLCRQACLLTSQRRFREASALWQTASMQEPQNIWVWFGLGNCLEQMDQSSRAAECYSACIALSPDYFGWYFNRGRMRMKKFEYELAKQDFARVFELNIGHAESYANLAIVQLELHDFSASVDSMQKAIEFGYDDAQGYLVLAQAYQKLGNAEAAQKSRKLAEESAPKSAQSWIARGVAKAKSEPLSAIHDLDNALRINVHSLPALESKSHILSEILDRTDDSIVVLDKAVQSFPENGPIRASRGVLLARLGRRSQAKADAQRALELDRSPAVMYQVAGIYAQLAVDSPSDGAQSIELLSAAIRQGYGSDLLDVDSDLKPIRELAEYQALRTAVRTINASEESCQ